MHEGEGLDGGINFCEFEETLILIFFLAANSNLIERLDTLSSQFGRIWKNAQ